MTNKPKKQGKPKGKKVRIVFSKDMSAEQIADAIRKKGEEVKKKNEKPD